MREVEQDFLERLGDLRYRRVVHPFTICARACSPSSCRGRIGELVPVREAEAVRIPCDRMRRQSSLFDQFGIQQQVEAAPIATPARA